VNEPALELGLDEEDAQLVRRIPPEAYRANGIPEPAQAVARIRAAELVSAALPELAEQGELRSSPLGPAWSRDLDVHVPALPDPEVLGRLGWLPLDPLLRRIGSGGEGRWALVEGDRVLAAVDFTCTEPLDPVDAIIDRCRRNARIRLREVLELRALVRKGAQLPDDPVVDSAARAEAELGGTLLGGHPQRSGSALPVALGPRVRRSAAALVRARMRRRVVVAVSGVDGSGKSTLSRLLLDSLTRCGIPAEIVWTRPGMRIGLLRNVAVVGKRVLGQGSEPGVREVARGRGGDQLASRRGLVGWTWAALVTAAFVADVLKRHIRGSGVLLYDRHRLDALATLRFAYEGVDTRVHEALIRRLLPAATVTLYLDVDAGTAVSRKPGDVIGKSAVEKQLASYNRTLRESASLHVLDGSKSAESLAFEAFRALLLSVE